VCVYNEELDLAKAKMQLGERRRREGGWLVGREENGGRGWR